MARFLHLGQVIHGHPLYQGNSASFHPVASSSQPLKGEDLPRPEGSSPLAWKASTRCISTDIGLQDLEAAVEVCWGTFRWRVLKGGRSETNHFPEGRGGLLRHIQVGMKACLSLIVSFGCAGAWVGKNTDQDRWPSTLHLSGDRGASQHCSRPSCGERASE